MNKKIVFLTGTRADYGKMKSLMKKVENEDAFENYVFVTGMHTMSEFGSTKNEILKDGYKNIQVYMNQIVEEPMDLILANTINGFSRYIREINPDLIVVHGDRVEALAGAITGALNNILVAHIEGGEVSGTIDESLRHAISKLAHVHFVSNDEAKNRLLQLGEFADSIFNIGSPDIDFLLSKNDFNLDEIKKRYDIKFDSYSILMYHPVTTDLDNLSTYVNSLVDAIIESGNNYIVIHPNNDLGYKIILDEYNRFKDYRDRIKIYPSIRFEYFIELLKKSDFLIGNSSAGIHEAPVLGVPSINIGNRQDGRFKYESITDCPNNKFKILAAISELPEVNNIATTNHFGDGNSSELFLKALNNKYFWKISKQKKFNVISR